MHRRTERLGHLAAALARGLALSALLAWAGTACAAAQDSAGKAIYQRGVTGSGAPLVATRADGITIRGKAAACINCHQRSGLGGREGRSFIPPITGRYLFHPRPKVGTDYNLPYVEGMRGDHDPYTDATLARAIREGLDSEGHPLTYLMPNYALDAADMASLIAYLKGLDELVVPGVTDATLHFATIITPDADPAKRHGMLAVLKQYFKDRNVRRMGPAPRILSSGKTIYGKTLTMARRSWTLHVWQLKGPASTWRAQLEQDLERQPVYAILSGLGGTNWAPIHDFCQQEQIPCLFPNVEVPVDRDTDFYPVYFSRGVPLEADLIAGAILKSRTGGKTKRVLQIYRAGDNGASGAAALKAALAGHGVEVTSEVLPHAPLGQGVARAVRYGVPHADVLVLWLRPPDLAQLGPAPPQGEQVYLSGLMGGLEQAPLPADWRARAHMAYPVDLPEKRLVRVDFARGWFRIRRLPVDDIQVETDTLLACGLLSETLAHMVDVLGRDYLVERLEMMIEHRIMTGYYPRLTLATDQRFASKGGYLVHFAASTGIKVVADGPWTVP